MQGRRRGGFTILELLIALMLIAIVASLAVPAWFDRSEVTLENACVLLARDLRLAQNRAAVMGEETVVEFSADGTGYTVFGPWGKVITHPRTRRPFHRDYSADGVFEDVRVDSVELGQGFRISFTPGGQARNGGRIVLRFGDERRAVCVETETGEIAIEGSDSGWVDDGT